MALKIKERYLSLNNAQLVHLADGEEINATVGGGSPIFDLFKDYVIQENGDQWLLLKDGKAKVVLTSDLTPKNAPFVPKSELDAAQKQIEDNNKQHAGEVLELRAKITELEKGEEAVKQGILARAVAFLKGIIGIKE